jgi:hypothetical protein
MDLQLFLQWAGAAGLVIGIVNTVWGMLGKGVKPFQDRLDRHSKDLIGHDRRIQTLEGLVPHLPTSAQVTDLRVTVERLDTHLGNLDKTIDVFSRMVTRIDDFLRENKA